MEALSTEELALRCIFNLKNEVALKFESHQRLFDEALLSNAFLKGLDHSPWLPIDGNKREMPILLSRRPSRSAFKIGSDGKRVICQDSINRGAVGIIKREIGTVGVKRVVAEQAATSVDNKLAACIFSSTLQITQSEMSDATDSEVKLSENEISASTTVHSFSQKHVVSKSQMKDGDHLSDMQPQVSTLGLPRYSVSRSSVMANHYNIRSRQLIGYQKSLLAFGRSVKAVSS